MTEKDWHRGDWMQTFTGRAFYPLAPRIEDIEPVDIAHSLAMQCRYNGHVQRFYSVAEHCVLLHDWIFEAFGEDNRNDEVTRNLALAALLHDAAEAYIGDMVRPLKRSMPDFCAVDDALTDLIYERFGLPFSKLPAVVKEADTRILLDERAVLLGAPPQSWSLGDAQPLGVEIKAWSPDVARVEYLSRLRALTS